MLPVFVNAFLAHIVALKILAVPSAGLFTALDTFFHRGFVAVAITLLAFYGHACCLSFKKVIRNRYVLRHQKRQRP
jgi:hypothetical protein